jgi:hypothetical protein
MKAHRKMTTTASIKGSMKDALNAKTQYDMEVTYDVADDNDMRMTRRRTMIITWRRMLIKKYGDGNHYKTLSNTYKVKNNEKGDDDDDHVA